jgi:hypothetical protein
MALANPIGRVMLSPAGQIFAFDKKGQQIAELQEPLIMAWAKLAESLGYDVDGTEIELLPQNGNAIKLVKLESGWTYDMK